MKAVATQIAPSGDGETRMCALTRALAPRSELLRFVASPSGEVVPDIKQVLPGRGVWITATFEAVSEAARRNVFARSLKTSVSVPDDLAQRIASLLKRDCISTLSMASKAGQAVAGFDKVSGLIASGRIAVLIGASDGAEDGRRKLAARLRNGVPTAQLIESLPSADLDLALGRTNVIHAAIMPGGLAEKFLACARFNEKYGPNGAALAAES